MFSHVTVSHILVYHVTNDFNHTVTAIDSLDIFTSFANPQQCTGKTTLVKALQEHFNNADECDGYRTSRPKFITELAASTSSGRARAVGTLQAILQVMLQGPRSWALCLLLDGRFVPGYSFLGVVLAAC